MYNIQNEKTGLAPVPAFAGVDVELFVVKVQLFGQLVGETPLTHEPADVLDRGPAVRSRAMEPAFRRD